MDNQKKRGKSSRDKGKRGELELANIFRDVYGLDVHRGMVFYHESDLVGLQGIHPEVKRVEALNIHKAMNQAIVESDAKGDGIPTVFHRKNNTEWLVTMKLDDWMDLYLNWKD